MKKIIILGVCLCLVLVLFFYTNKKNTFETRSQLLLGTMCEITLSIETEEEREHVFAEAFQIVRDIQDTMSIYSSTSELTKVNTYAHVTPSEISRDLLTVIQKSLDVSELTDGAFDVTSFPLSKLWGFSDTESLIPSMREVTKIRELVGYEYIHLESIGAGEGETGGAAMLQFEKPGVMIDLGGIAKGYACDKVVECLKKNSVSDALVNIGGTIYAFGTSAYGKAWVVGIRDPRNKKEHICSIELDGKAVSTSGDYEQYFMHEGKRYTHIIDPRNGYPVEDVIAVTVMASTAMDADAFSTALFVLGPEKGISVAKKQDGLDAMIMYDTGSGPQTKKTSLFD